MKIKSLITAVSSALALFISTTMIGFSLIELLVVVAIIGILAAIGTVGYNNYVNSARVAATVANAVSISEALQACDAANNCGKYIPTGILDINSPRDSSLVSNIVAGLGYDVSGVPLNPLDGIAFSSNARNPWDNSQLSMINSNIDSFGTGSTGGGYSGCTGLGHIVVGVLYNNTVQIQACTIDTNTADPYSGLEIYAADPKSPAPFQMINIHS